MLVQKHLAFLQFKAEYLEIRWLNADELSRSPIAGAHDCGFKNDLRADPCQRRNCSRNAPHIAYGKTRREFLFFLLVLAFFDLFFFLLDDRFDYDVIYANEFYLIEDLLLRAIPDREHRYNSCNAKNYPECRQK